MMKTLLPRVACLAFVLFAGAQELFAIGHTVTITSSSNVLCNGGSTGSATASVSGGTGPFTFSWAPSGGTNATATNLSAATYTVTVTDQSDMSTATATVSITQPTALTASNSTIPACFNTCQGYANATANGGVAPYAFQWNDPNNQATAFAYNLCPGTYTCTVTDANACVAYTVATVGQYAQPVVNMSSVTPTCANLCNGSATGVWTNPTTFPLTYIWSPAGQTTATATNLCPGNYTVTITDGNGCMATGSVVINSTTVTITGTVSTTASGCNTCSGTATVSPGGGTAPYSYLWNSSDTTQSVSNQCPGMIQVTVTDASGCSETLTGSVGNANGFMVTTAAQNTTCFFNSNGSITATATGGVPPYTYQWYQLPSTLLSGQTSSTLSNFPPGHYMVVANDASGCTMSVSDTIFSGPHLYLSISATMANCANNATAIAHTFGGTPPYTFSWSNSMTGDTITGVAPGPLSVTVTDSNGCMASGNIIVYSACDNIIRGRVYEDPNTDCVYNTGDMALGNRYVYTVPGNYGDYTDAQGNYEIRVPVAGTYNVQTMLWNFAYTCPANGINSAIFLQTGDTLFNLDFRGNYLPPNPPPNPGNIQNLWVNLSSGVARPGFQMGYSLWYGNSGNTTMIDDTLTFTHDALLSLISSSLPYSSYTNPTVTWYIDTLLPGQSGMIQLVMQVPTIQNGGCIGCPLQSTAQILPIIGDNFPANNTSIDNRLIQGSYDPNLKECWAPMINPQNGDIDLYVDTTLSYTIHFQNTGTDTAFTVVIRDTIPAELDLGTFEPGAASHAYTVDLDDPRVLVFTFNNILLPDSFVNEPASHGWVKFGMKRVPGLPVGTVINNTAHNYFDFNLPVATNTTSNLIVNPLFISAVTNSPGVSAVPNPFDESTTLLIGGEAQKNFSLELFDMSGRRVLGSGPQRGNRYALERGTLESGVYLCRVSGDVNAVMKLIIR